MEEDIEARKEQLKLDLAERLMKTIPEVPENFHSLSQEQQDRIFSTIDERSAKISDLLGGTRQRRTTGARRPRRSERFNTPQLDMQPVKRRKPREASDEE